MVGFLLILVAYLNSFHGLSAMVPEQQLTPVAPYNSCCLGNFQPTCCNGVYPPRCCYPSVNYTGGPSSLPQSVFIDNNAAFIGQQNVMLGPQGYHGYPIYPLPLPMLPGYSKTYHYQYAPQPPMVHHVPWSILPALPQWKPAPLPKIEWPTMAPFVFPTLPPLDSRRATPAPWTPAPLKFNMVHFPTLPPYKVPVYPTLPPPKYATYVFPTLPPMKVLLPPEVPKVEYKDVHWPTLPPYKVAILPKAQPLKYKEVPWPTLQPWLISVPDVPEPEVDVDSRKKPEVDTTDLEDCV